MAKKGAEKPLFFVLGKLASNLAAPAADFSVQ